MAFPHGGLWKPLWAVPMMPMAQLSLEEHRACTGGRCVICFKPGEKNWIMKVPGSSETGYQPHSRSHSLPNPCSHFFTTLFPTPSTLPLSILFAYLGHLAPEVAWKHQVVTATLQEKRKEKARFHYQKKKQLREIMETGQKECGKENGQIR